MNAHIDALVDDYVLDLLPAEERRRVELHAALCPRCRQLLAAERTRTARVESALRSSAAPLAGRLEALWPEVRTAVVRRERWPVWVQQGWWLQWQAAFATFALLLVLAAVLMGTAVQLDGWLVGTYTPPVVSETASPTASMTPTWAQPAFPGGAQSANPARQGTPAPVLVSYSPQPQPMPPAPSLDGR